MLNFLTALIFFISSNSLLHSLTHYFYSPRITHFNSFIFVKHCSKLMLSFDIVVSAESRTPIGRGRGRSSDRLQMDLDATQITSVSVNGDGGTTHNVQAVDDRLVVSIDGDRNCDTRTKKTSENFASTFQRSPKFRQSAEHSPMFKGRLRSRNSGERADQTVHRREQMLETAVSSPLVSSADVSVNQQDDINAFMRAAKPKTSNVRTNRPHKNSNGDVAIVLGKKPLDCHLSSDDDVRLLAAPAEEEPTELPKVVFQFVDKLQEAAVNREVKERCPNMVSEDGVAEDCAGLCSAFEDMNLDDDDDDDEWEDFDGEEKDD